METWIKLVIIIMVPSVVLKYWFSSLWCICQSFDSGEIDYYLFLDPSNKASLSLGVFYYYVVTFAGYLIFKMIIINVVLICIITQYVSNKELNYYKNKQ